MVRCFLTICTAERHPAFVDPETVGQTLTHFLQIAQRRDVAIVAYCFMPDHVHLVAQGVTDGADIRRFVHESKQRSAHAYSIRLQQRLWQPSYYDRILRGDEDTWSAIRYVVANPVRAGLVDDPHGYAFSGSGVYSRKDLFEGCCAPHLRDWSPR